MIPQWRILPKGRRKEKKRKPQNGANRGAFPLLILILLAPIYKIYALVSSMMVDFYMKFSKLLGTRQKVAARKSQERYFGRGRRIGYRAVGSIFRPGPPVKFKLSGVP